MGHSSSAYSLPRVMPRGRVTAAHTIIACQPQKRKPRDAHKQARLAGTLRHVEGRAHQGTAAERENHSIGVQGPDTAVREPRNIEAQCGPVQFCGDEHADQHAHDAPDDRHQGELPDDFVIIGFRSGSAVRGSCHPTRSVVVSHFSPVRLNSRMIDMLRADSRRYFAQLGRRGDVVYAYSDRHSARYDPSLFELT